MMKKESKFSAKSLYYHPQSQQFYSKIETKQLNSLARRELIFFPSTHEFKVYRALLSLADKFFLEVHPKVQIIPPKVLKTFPQGKKWTVDFLLRDKDDRTITALIEAKGIISKDFPLILALLELHNKELFDKTWLIFPSKIPTQCQVIKNLIEIQPCRVETLALFTKRMATLKNTAFF